MRMVRWRGVRHNMKWAMPEMTQTLSQACLVHHKETMLHEKLLVDRKSNIDSGRNLIYARGVVPKSEYIPLPVQRQGPVVRVDASGDGARSRQLVDGEEGIEHGRQARRPYKQAPVATE